MVDTATFTAVDLSQLPAPTVIEALSYEDIRAAMIARLQALLPGFDATVESDPAVKVLEVAAYREFLLRGRVNDAARAVMPAFAIGADLDQLAALMGIVRLVLDPGNAAAGVLPTFESDTDFRRRLVLAPEGYSTAGPEGAYVFHATSADGNVLDASATSPSPGVVIVTILSRVGDGTASPDLLAIVDAHVSDETRRPLTDAVTVQSAAIVDYAIVASLTTFAGPDGSIVMAEAQRRLAVWIAKTQRLGLDITRAGIIGALMTEGVQNIVLAQPAVDIVLDRTQAGWCSGATVTYTGVGE